MNRKILTEKELLKIDKFTFEKSPYKFIKIGIWLVMKCNFNDDRLIENVCISIDELVDKPLVWLDLYNGRSKDAKKRIAFYRLDGDKLYAIIDDGEKREACIIERACESFVDDYGDNMLINARVSLNEKKESWW